MMSQYNPNLNQAVVDDHRRALVAAASRRRLAAVGQPAVAGSGCFSPQRTK